jgi:hypothetical protein
MAQLPTLGWPGRACKVSQAEATFHFPAYALASPVPKREEKRQLGGLLSPITETVGNTLGGLAGPGGLLEGLLGSLGAATVRSEDKRPDAAHPFQVNSKTLWT